MVDAQNVFCPLILSDETFSVDMYNFYGAGS